MVFKDQFIQIYRKSKQNKCQSPFLNNPYSTKSNFSKILKEKTVATCVDEIGRISSCDTSEEVSLHMQHHMNKINNLAHRFENKIKS